MPTREETREMQRAMVGLRTVVEARMRVALQRVADQYPDPRQFRDVAVRVTQSLTRQYGAQAGVFAAQWYNSLRAQESLRTRYVASGLVGDYDTQIEQTVRRAVAGLFSDTPDVVGVLTVITNRAGKYVTDNGWETVRRNSYRDPEAAGWRRVAIGETCDFCLMLTGRGGVYSRESVQFRSHAGCNCGAAPAWDQDAVEVPEIAYQASARTSGMSEAQRAAHNERIQEWITRNRSSLAELREELAA